MVGEQSGSLKGKPVYLYADAKDEYGLVPPTRQLHRDAARARHQARVRQPDDPVVAVFTARAGYRST